MASIHNLVCCGWAELHGVQQYTRRSFASVLSVALSRSKGALVFSSASRSAAPRTCGSTRFAKDVQKHKLGDVIALPTFRNPNSGRTIVPYMWIVDRKALEDYCLANNIKVATYGYW